MYVRNNAYSRMKFLLVMLAVLFESCYLNHSVDVSEGIVTVKFQQNVDGELQYKLDDEASFRACKLLASHNYVSM